MLADSSGSSMLSIRRTASSVKSAARASFDALEHLPGRPRRQLSRVHPQDGRIGDHGLGHAWEQAVGVLGVLQIGDHVRQVDAAVGRDVDQPVEQFGDGVADPAQRDAALAHPDEDHRPEAVRAAHHLHDPLDVVVDGDLREW